MKTLRSPISRSPVTFHHSLAALCVFSIALASRCALAVEGSLPRDVMDRYNAEQWTLVLGGTSASDVVKHLNKLGSLRVALDTKLASIKVAKYEINADTIIGGAEKLAKQLKANAFVLRDFVYIAKDLPPGVTPTSIEVKTAAKPAPLAAKAAPLTTLKATFPGLKPGSSKKIKWLRKGPDDCRKDGKPLVLFVVGGDPTKDNPTAALLEVLLLEEDAVLKALAEFSFVIIGAADAAGWSAATVEPGRKSAALLLLACDGTLLATYTENAAMRPELVVAAAARTVEANTAAKERLAKAAPPKPDEGKKDPPRFGEIPGLPPKSDDEKDEAAKKDDPPKKDPPPKKDVIEEE